MSKPVNESYDQPGEILPPHKPVVRKISKSAESLHFDHGIHDPDKAAARHRADDQAVLDETAALARQQAGASLVSPGIANQAYIQAAAYASAAAQRAEEHARGPGIKSAPLVPLRQHPGFGPCQIYNGEIVFEYLPGHFPGDPLVFRDWRWKPVKVPIEQLRDQARDLREEQIILEQRSYGLELCREQLKQFRDELKYLTGLPVGNRERNWYQQQEVRSKIPPLEARERDILESQARLARLRTVQASVDAEIAKFELSDPASIRAREEQARQAAERKAVQVERTRREVEDLLARLADLPSQLAAKQQELTTLEGAAS